MNVHDAPHRRLGGPCCGAARQPENPCCRKGRWVGSRAGDGEAPRDEPGTARQHEDDGSRTAGQHEDDGSRAGDGQAARDEPGAARRHEDDGCSRGEANG